MSFKGVLERLLAGVPGAQGAILVDWEGEAVDQAGRMDDYDLKVVGAWQGVILQQLRTAIARSGRERLCELAITTAAVQTLILPVTDEYFLLLALDRDTLSGRARLAARRCVRHLQQEFA